MRGLILILFSIQAHAAVQTNIKEIGPHTPILTFEKNENPQNIMMIYTNVDSECHISKDAKNQPLLDYYWLMDRKNYKPVHRMIKSGIRERLAKGKSGPNSFEVHINDLKELKSDLKDPHMEIVATSKGKDCNVEADMALGPSDHDRILKLQTISVESERSMWPPFRKVKSVTLLGTDKATGEKVTRAYRKASD